MTRLALLVAAALAVAPMARAETFTLGAISVIEPTAAPTTPSQMSDAGFMVIRNDGDTPDYLTGASGDFATLTLHQTTVDANGVARMTAVPRLEIPAHGQVALAHGSYHLMMTGLTRPLSAGDSLPATLTFQNAGPLAIRFTITTGMAGMNMGG